MLAEFDISIVINLHNETPFLRRTLWSLEEAALFCRGLGLSVEAVVVLDNAPPSTSQWAATHDFSAFDSHQIISVAHGSLGQSRNSGVEIARGQYIGTADADDLISYNAFAELYGIVKGQPYVIAVPKYLCAFGSSSWTSVYYGTRRVSKLEFFGHHPYISRIFAHRRLFEAQRYADIPLGNGFAYEDWHFNTEALASGYEFEVAPRTIFFYRQRPNSLLKGANALSVRQIPYSTYFAPEKFLRICASDFAQSETTTETPCAAELLNEFLSDEVCLELLLAANHIDPGIRISNVQDSPLFTNILPDNELGAAYFRISERVTGCQFSDVLLVPFMATGGGERYILDVIRALKSLDPSRRILVLSDELVRKHSWLDRLPGDSVFIDLREFLPSGDHQGYDLIALRLVQAVAADATIHLKGCFFSHRFCMKFANVLPRNRFVYYRFCDPIVPLAGALVTEGYAFDFLSECGQQLDLLVSDHAAILDHDLARLDFLRDCVHHLPALCPPSPSLVRNNRERTGRLLWASRLDRQKRPDLLLKIGCGLGLQMPEVSIDMYGSVVLDELGADAISATPNVRYCGGFLDFRELDHQSYDGFVYTSDYDGLPNVVLEAQAAGLPVIAPNVGGIGEVVRTGETGWLIEGGADEANMVQAYIQAIGELTDPRTDLELLTRNALKQLGERHSEEVYFENVKRIFLEGMPEARLSGPSTPEQPLA